MKIKRMERASLNDEWDTDVTSAQPSARVEVEQDEKILHKLCEKNKA